MHRTLRLVFSELSHGVLDLRIFVPSFIVEAPRNVEEYADGGQPRLINEPDVLQDLIDSGDVATTPDGLIPAGETVDEVFDAIFFAYSGECATNGYERIGGQARQGQTFAALGTPALQTYHASWVNVLESDCSVSRGDDPEIRVAAHEIGHTLQRTPLAPHPAAYANAYELMDSCNGCFPGGYMTLPDVLRLPNELPQFSNWKPESVYMTLNPTSVSTNIEIAPVELDPRLAPHPQVVRIFTNQPYSYLLECRRPIGADSVWSADPVRDATGGVQILQVYPDGVPGGPSEVETMVVTDPADSSAFGSLWNPSSASYTDVSADLTISIGPDAGASCAATVNYGPSALTGAPDVGLTPWLTEPNFRYETIVIWVDSSCNGYEEDDPAGLRFGRSGGNVNGIGDPPCAFEENRVYARITNFGDQPANNISVTIDRTTFHDVGVWSPSDWVEIGTAPPVPSLAPGESVDVYVPWYPMPDLEEALEEGRVDIHSCLRVRVDQVVAPYVETNLTNQNGDNEQENIDYYEIVISPTSGEASSASGSLVLSNDGNEARTFYLSLDIAELPAGWGVDVGGGVNQVTVPASSVAEIPVSLVAPSGLPGIAPSESFDVVVTALVEREVADPRDPSGTNHLTAMSLVDGLILRGYAVTPVEIGITSFHDDMDGTIYTHGCLSDRVAGVPVRVQHIAPWGANVSTDAATDDSGCFSTEVQTGLQGIVRVRAVFSGTSDRQSAASNVIQVGAYAPMGTCCSARATPLCDRTEVEACVCAADPFCCSTAWDSVCVGEVESLGCSTCGDYCAARTQPGSYIQSVELCVCSIDAYCCQTAWDALCVSEVSSLGCGSCP